MGCVSGARVRVRAVRSPARTLPGSRPAARGMDSSETSRAGGGQGRPVTCPDCGTQVQEGPDGGFVCGNCMYTVPPPAPNVRNCEKLWRRPRFSAEESEP